MSLCAQSPREIILTNTWGYVLHNHHFLRLLTSIDPVSKKGNIVSENIYAQLRILSVETQ